MLSITPLSYSADSITRAAYVGTEGVPEALSMVGDVGPMVVAGGVLVLLGLAVVALWRSDARKLLSFSGATDSESEPHSDVNASSVGADSDESSAVATEPVSTTGARSRTEDDQVSTQEEQSDPELVVGILEENDGRMRQAAIVDETEWSKSKVSMVLSEMEEDGHISKLRVGRENIVSLTGNEPEAAGSPFDDE